MAVAKARASGRAFIYWRMILSENRFPLFGIMRVRQVSRPWSRIIVDGGCESAGVRPRIYILAHDLVRKPVPTFRDHARATGIASLVTHHSRWRLRKRGRPAAHLYIGA